MKQNNQTYPEDVKRNKRTIPAVLIIAGLFPFISFLLMEFAVQGSSVASVFSYCFSRIIYFLPAWIIFSFVMLSVALLTRRVWISCALISVVFSVLAYSNYYKMLWWNQPVQPKDIRNIASGIHAIGLVKAYPTVRMIIAFSIFIVITALTAKIVIPKMKLIVRLLLPISFIAFAVIIFQWIFVSDKGKAYYQFDEFANPAKIYEQYSFFPSLFHLVDEQLLHPLIPEDYTDQSLEEIAQEISVCADNKQVERSPDIIAILYESYFDPGEYGYEFDVDIHQNYKKASETGYSGNILSPLYGGGTANAEFEVLTGLSTENKYISSIAYEDVCYPGFPNIVNYLKSSGYHSLAIHAYDNSLFNRSNAYEYLGFDSSMFQEEFLISNTMTARNFLSDLASIQELENRYESMTAQSDQPVFINLVSMQNHAPYKETVQQLSRQQYPIVHLVDSTGLDEKTVSELEGFATLTKLTDDSIGELIDYYSNVDRDVIIVLYGDHQVTFSDRLFSDISEDPDAEVILHTTPYLVWANFETTSGTFGTLPFSELLPNALKVYNADRPAYFDWIIDSAFPDPVSGISGDKIILQDQTIAQRSMYSDQIIKYFDVVFDISSQNLLIENMYKQ